MEDFQGKVAVITGAASGIGCGVEEWIEKYRKGVREGMSPDELTKHVFEAMRENRFYILPHPEFKERVRVRMEDILEERNPTAHYH